MNNHRKDNIIDPKEVLNFWEKRARKYAESEVNLSNLEPDPQLAKLKHQLECEVLKDYMRVRPHFEMLDLGAGHGAWTARFAPHVKHVDAVEFSAAMLERAREYLDQRGIDNVRLYHQSAQTFLSAKQYDIVLISGLLIYLNPQDLEQLLANLEKMVKPGGRVVLRDGTARETEYTIKSRYSEGLKDYYSAYYRTAKQYIDAFTAHGFRVLRHQDMFPEGSPFNKWKETILRVYEFIKEDNKKS